MGPISAFYIQKGVSVVIHQEVDLMEGINASRIWFYTFSGVFSGTMAILASDRSEEGIHQAVILLALFSSLFSFIQAIIAVKYKTHWAIKTKIEKINLVKLITNLLIISFYAF